jgi:hypothetical protein
MAMHGRTVVALISIPSSVNSRGGGGGEWLQALPALLSVILSLNSPQLSN